MYATRYTHIKNNTCICNIYKRTHLPIHIIHIFDHIYVNATRLHNKTCCTCKHIWVYTCGYTCCAQQLFAHAKTHVCMYSGIKDTYTACHI